MGGESRAVRDAFRREAGDDVFAGIVLMASKQLVGKWATGQGPWRTPPAAPHGGSISGNAV